MKLGPFTLYPHQVKAVDAARDAFRRGARRVLIQAPCGAGKTLKTSAIMSLAMGKGKKALFLASGRKLITQKSLKLADCGIPHAVLMSREPWVAGHSCVVSSKDTFAERCIKTSRLPLPAADVIIVDECVTGDTRINTNIGEMCIKDVETYKPTHVLSYNGSSLTMSAIVALKRQGTKDTLLVEAGGRTIQCTANHPFLTKRGWVQAANLLKSDMVLCVSVGAAPGSLGETPAEGSDGSFKGTTAGLPQSELENNGSPDITSCSLVRRFASAGAAKGSDSGCLWSNSSVTEQRDIGHTCEAIIGRGPGGSKNSPALSEWLFWERFSAIHQSDTRTLEVSPLGLPVIMARPRSAGFTIRRGHCVVSVRSCPSAKTRDTETLRCGFGRVVLPHSTPSQASFFEMDVRPSRSDGWTGSEMSALRGGYATTVADPAGECTFTRKATRGRNAASSRRGSAATMAKRLFAQMDEATSSSRSRRMPKEQSFRSSSRTSQSVCNTNWMAVESVTPASPQDVFDIQVKGTECFFANGMLVHNCHLAGGKEWQDIYKEYPDALMLGVTATPALGNGKPLPGWDAMVSGGTYSELIAGGFLVDAVVYAPFMVDMSGVKVNKQSGEFVLEQMQARYDDRVLVGDFIKCWKELAENRLTGFFASSVKASIGAAEAFNAAGIPAAHMDADTDDEEREAAFAAARAGRIKVLCNFGVLRVGVDLPEMECVQLAVSMNSLNTYLQTVGRGGRKCIFPDGRVKKNYILIDHGGNVHKHGWPTEDHEWSITDERTVQERDAERAEREKKPREPLCCPECGAMRQSGPKCLNCGFQHKRTGLKVRTVEGELKPLERKAAKEKRQRSDSQKLWLQCLSICANRGMTFKQAAWLFKEKCGDWPPDSVGPQPPPEKRGQKVRDVYPNWGKKGKA